MALWDLRDKDGEICVAEVEATSKEMLVVVEAANTKQPDTAPHHATEALGDGRVESDDTMSEDVVDRAICRSEEGDL